MTPSPIPPIPYNACALVDASGLVLFLCGLAPGQWKKMQIITAPRHPTPTFTPFYRRPPLPASPLIWHAHRARVQERQRQGARGRQPSASMLVGHPLVLRPPSLVTKTTIKRHQNVSRRRVLTLERVSRGDLEERGEALNKRPKKSCSTDLFTFVTAPTAPPPLPHRRRQQNKDCACSIAGSNR